MIKFQISILLGFSLSNKSNEKGKKGKKKPSKKTKEKKGKKAKKSSPIKEDKEESCKYSIKVGSPVGYAHIEYDLIPGRQNQKIDVICWGPVAKVFLAEEDLTFKTYIYKEIAWVPICIKHILHSLTDSDHFNLHSHVVNYTIFTKKNKLGNRAKSEKSKEFFIQEGDIISSEKFIKAYINDPNLETGAEEKHNVKELTKEIRNISFESSNDDPEASEETILEFISDPLHLFQINKIIDCIINGKEVECKDFTTICSPLLIDSNITKKNKSKKKNKKKSGKTKQSPDILKIPIPGEVFYTDPKFSIYNLKQTSSTLHHGFILTTVANLLTKLQKYSINPLVIKIHKLSNIPQDILANHGITRIYIYYNVPSVVQCKSLEKSLATNIKFNEAHAFFTRDIPKLKLLELLQSQRLRVEICGVLNKPDRQNVGALFGYKQSDKNISNKLTSRNCIKYLELNKEHETVTLAVACYDLSSIVATSNVLEKAACHHPDNMTTLDVSNIYMNSKFVDATTINEINLGFEGKSKSMSPLSEQLLLHFQTMLKVQVSLSAPFKATLEIYTLNNNIFCRLFFIVNCGEVAATLLNQIMLHNQRVIGPEIIAPNYLKRDSVAIVENDIQDSPVSTSAYTGALTGFMLDNGHTYAFFLEGIANGMIRDIWDNIMDADYSVLRTFYNSDYRFEKRLYTAFIKYNGVYTIHLKMPLEQILNQDKLYVEGNVPIPCWEALKKLNILFKCTTLKSMNQYSAFPSSAQLLSLDFEFGVPLKWKLESQKENKKVLKQSKA